MPDGEDRAALKAPQDRRPDYAARRAGETAAGDRPPEAVDAAAEGNGLYKWKTFAAVGLSTVTMVMSFSIVFLALSSIAEDFNVTLRAVSWVVIAQSLTLSSTMLPLGRVADITGRKSFLLAGLALFAGGAIFASFSTSLTMLIVARVVMAIGSAMGQSVGTAIIVSVFPSKERGKGLGSQTTAVAIGGAAGPIIGGLLLQAWSWQGLFIFMAIPSAIAFLWGLYILDDKRIGSTDKGSRQRYDWLGALVSAGGMVSIILTINNPFGFGWGSPQITGGAVLAVILFSGFIWWELRVAQPMLNLRMFKHTVFRYAIATRYLAFMGTSATLFMMPVFLQSLQGRSEALTGMIMFFSALGMGIAAQTSGRLSDRFGYRRFTLMGFAVLISTAAGFSFFSVTTPTWVIIPALFVNGIGMGLWSAPNMSATMGAVPRSAYGVVGALVNLTRNVGNTVGQAVIATIITGVMISGGFDIGLGDIATTEGADRAFLSGWKVAYLTVTGFAAAALLTAYLTNPRREPARRTGGPEAPAG